MAEVKKRGRKAKDPTNVEPNKVADGVPKKRGRKPKGGKIIQQDTNKTEHIEAKPNIILHLKCSLSDIHDHSSCNDSIAPTDSNMLANSKNPDLNFHFIENNSSMLNCAKTQECGNSQEAINKVSDNTADHNRNINSKLKDLEKNLHFNNIGDKKSACFWCTCGFDNPTVYIPKSQIKDDYNVYGCFCSPECATAYLMNENIDSSTKFERYHLLCYIYAKIYNYEKNIKPAPNPHYLLDKYYGNLSIQEYRKLLRNQQLLLVVDKPLTRVLPELHEDNDEFLLNSKGMNGSNLKLKRSKTILSKTNSLSESFGLVM